jgi:hypothetical protein
MLRLLVACCVVAVACPAAADQAFGRKQGQRTTLSDSTDENDGGILFSAPGNLRIHFVSKFDLLRAAPDQLSRQDRLRAENVRRTLALNAAHGLNLTASFIGGDDAACAALIRDVSAAADSAAPGSPEANKSLADFFAEETREGHKTDLCLGASLLAHGGFVADPDVKFRLPLSAFVRPATGFFATLPVGRAAQFLLPGVVGAAPNHPVLARFLALALEFYRGAHALECGMDGGECAGLGARLLYEGFRGWAEGRPAAAAVPRAAVVRVGEGGEGGEGSAEGEGEGEAGGEAAKVQAAPEGAQLVQEHWKQAEPRVDKSVPSQDGVGCCCDVVGFDPVTLAAPFFLRFPGRTWFCVDRAAVPALPEEEPELCRELVARGIDLGSGFCERAGSAIKND